MERNKPTPEGRALGAQVARLTENAIADVRANQPDVVLPERCKSCAFRLGTYPNGCPETLLDAIDCVQNDVPFLCHVHKKGEPKHLCAGFVACQTSVKMQTVKKIVSLQPPGFVAPWRLMKVEKEGVK